MEAVYLDTHVVVWLFQKDLKKFSSKVLEILEQKNILVSAMVLVELEFLYEIKRLTYQPKHLLLELENAIDLKICNEKFSKIAYESLKVDWTKDPFDRLIVANAQYNKASLITKDQNILKNYSKAIW